MTTNNAYKPLWNEYFSEVLDMIWHAAYRLLLRIMYSLFP